MEAGRRGPAQGVLFQYAFADKSLEDVADSLHRRLIRSNSRVSRMIRPTFSTRSPTLISRCR